MMDLSEHLHQGCVVLHAALTKLVLVILLQKDSVDVGILLIRVSSHFDKRGGAASNNCL